MVYVLIKCIQRISYLIKKTCINKHENISFYFASYLSSKATQRQDKIHKRLYYLFLYTLAEL